MAEIINFNNDTELTEEEIEVLKAAENTQPLTGKYLDQVNAKMMQDELRIKNGMEPKYDARDLFAESLQAVIMDTDEEMDEILQAKKDR